MDDDMDDLLVLSERHTNGEEGVIRDEQRVRRRRHKRMICSSDDGESVSGAGDTVCQQGPNQGQRKPAAPRPERPYSVGVAAGISEALSGPRQPASTADGGADGVAGNACPHLGRPVMASEEGDGDEANRGPVGDEAGEMQRRVAAPVILSPRRPETAGGAEAATQTYGCRSPTQTGPCRRGRQRDGEATPEGWDWG